MNDEKEEKLFSAVTGIPDELIEEAQTAKLKRAPRPWKVPAALAACAVLIVGLMTFLPRSESAVEGHSATNALVGVIMPQADAASYDSVDETFLTAVNGFSYETASRLLADSGGNANYSPISLYYALALAASGARGKTADELLSLLGVSGQSALSAQCGNLYRLLYKDTDYGKLQIGSSLWMASGIKWKDAFVKNAAENFYASSYSVDFSDPETAEGMAAWIVSNTNGALNPQLEADPGMILSILNTVYFKDQWIDGFDETATAPGQFRLPDGSTADCDFMNQDTYSTGFTKGDGFTRATLGLKNGESMIFILPDEGVTPRELLSGPEKVQAMFAAGDTDDGQVTWRIPKFSFHSELDDLADTLKNLGLRSAFEPDANFSGITDSPAFISRIRQETQIGIDEKGVEASAYTQIYYVTGAIQADHSAEMILDRPFIYGITMNYWITPTAMRNVLLFAGICENPVEG
ncbi:MAG: serpin family protein [Defluviitaleaceae bacterium]|nr:serpin family protein [Defluviitaleaceae bacterium]